MWVGTRDGGAFESPFILVLELDAHGRAERVDFYDPHHLERALARFDEINAHVPIDPFAAVDQPSAATQTQRSDGASTDALARIAKPNAASLALQRWQAGFRTCVDTNDWDALGRLCTPGMIFEDRQRRALVSGGAELMIASARERAVAGARPESRQVGTAGDRVAIYRTLWSGGPADGLATLAPGGRSPRNDSTRTR